VSTREAAIAALHTALSTALAARSPAPQVLRNETVPQRVPAGGLVIVRDGEQQTETPMLSPLSYAIEHGADVEIIASGATAVDRDDLLDALLMDVSAAIVADRTLGGAVEWANLSAPSFDDVVVEGAAPLKAAIVTVSLAFTVAASPLN
jgi:hypothetical protein